jgi:hypothetical protein
MLYRVNDHLGLLAGCGIIKVDELFAADPAAEDGEVLPDPVDVKRVGR